jgi:hypothetical protein
VSKIFFHLVFSWVSLPQPQSIPLRLFGISLKIRGDIRKSRCTTVSTTPAANFAISFTGVVDIGGKVATGVNDTGGKFATGVNNTGRNLPPVTMTPVATFHQYQQQQHQICHQSINNTGGKQW